MGNYIKPNKEQHQFIIGIDFGHGETSADICNIQWNDEFAKLENPDSIEIFNNLKATKSILFKECITDLQGNESIRYSAGAQAHGDYLNRKSQSCELYAYFKKRPSLMKLDGSREIMMHFMQEIYLQIRRQRSELKDNNHVVYIACPSDVRTWTDDEMKEYAQIALDAGIPLAKIDDCSIGIVRESRAAFIKARQNSNSRYSIREGILLIDFGSSTVDLTYYSSELLDKPFDGGDNCGASGIESEIFNHLKTVNEKVAECVKICKPSEIAILLGIRDSKENFYRFNAIDMEIDLKASKMTLGQITEGRIEKMYSKDDLDQLLSGYKESIIKCFENFRKNHLKKNPIRLVFLTGGASRMNFIEEIVRDVFKYKGDIYRDNDPSLTISNGIAIAGRADLRSASLLEVLLEKIDVYSIQNNIAEKVIDLGSLAITDAFLDIVKKKYEAFKDSKTDSSIAMLEADVKDALNEVNYSFLFNKQFEFVLREEVNNSVLPYLNAIVADYFPDEKIKDITSNHKLSTNLSISAENVDSIFSNSVESISESVVVGLLKFFAGLAGILIAIALAGLTTLFGEDFWKQVNNIASKILPDWNGKETILDLEKRLKIFENFIKEKEQFSLNIREQLKKDMDSDENLKESIINSFREEAKQYVKEQINQVRLMLN